MLRYWDNRYRKQRLHTVEHCDTPQGETEQATLLVHGVLDRLAKYFTGRKVLDFGCGWGRNIGKIVALGTREVYGADVNVWALTQAWNRHPSGTFVRLDPDGNLPFRDEMFDTVLSWTVLQHVPPEEIAATCSELQRVLKRRTGFVVLAENVTDTEDRDHIWFRSKELYRKLFAGWHLVFHERLTTLDCRNEPHQLLVLRRPQA